MALVNTDFPSSRKGNLESENMENIIEVNIWLIMGIYKAPSMSDNDFSTYFIKNIDECIRYYENIILLGDLNFDMVNNQKCQTLNDLCDVFNLSQLITNPTCFKKGCTPSLVDVILTNQRFNFQQVLVYNLISVTMKGKVQSQQQKNISYRSYKNFEIFLTQN